MFELDSILAEIERNQNSVGIDEIKNRLQPFMKGCRVVCPIFDPGVFLYRARKLDETFKKSVGVRLADLIYPPKSIARLGRLNREGQSVFYCSMHKQSVFFEIPGLKKYDELILTFWKTTEKMLLNNVGYTEYVFKLLGAKRDLPNWELSFSKINDERESVKLSVIEKKSIPRSVLNSEEVNARDLFSRFFAQMVEPAMSDIYKLTTAIGELHLGNVVGHDHQFAGILYPSIRMWANGDNVSLLPWFVDRHLQFRKAVHIRIDDYQETTFSITYLDSANTFDANGNLVWLGRLPNWTLNKNGQRAKFTLTSGRDEDGDFQASKDGTPCHWVAVDEDTGEIIVPK